MVPIARACANYPKKTELLYAFSPSSSSLGYEATPDQYDIASYPRRERRAKKRTVVRGTPGFLGVVGVCACNRYQALSPPPRSKGLGTRLGATLPQRHPPSI